MFDYICLFTLILTSLSSSTYRSPSTDPEQTNYHLEETTNQSTRKGRKKESANPKSPAAKNMRPPTEPKASNRGVQPQKSTTRPAATSPQRRVLESKSTRGQNSQNPKKLVGAARRKGPTPAMLETIRLQQSTDLAIPKAPFSRLVREIIQNMSNEPLRMTPDSLEALRESSEMYLTSVFTDAFRITLNRNQVTLQRKDIQLLMLLQGPGSVGAR